MPIKFNGRTFQHFRQAQSYVMRKKRFGKKIAGAYVAAIERVQRGTRVRYRRRS